MVIMQVKAVFESNGWEITQSGDIYYSKSENMNERRAAGLPALDNELEFKQRLKSWISWGGRNDWPLNKTDPRWWWIKPTENLDATFYLT